MKITTIALVLFCLVSSGAFASGVFASGVQAADTSGLNTRVTNLESETVALKTEILELKDRVAELEGAPKDTVLPWLCTLTITPEPTERFTFFGRGERKGIAQEKAYESCWKEMLIRSRQRHCDLESMRCERE